MLGLLKDTFGEIFIEKPYGLSKDLHQNERYPNVQRYHLLSETMNLMQAFDPRSRYYMFCGVDFNAAQAADRTREDNGKLRNKNDIYLELKLKETFGEIFIQKTYGLRRRSTSK